MEALSFKSLKHTFIHQLLGIRPSAQGLILTYCPFLAMLSTLTITMKKRQGRIEMCRMAKKMCLSAGAVVPVQKGATHTSLPGCGWEPGRAGWVVGFQPRLSLGNARTGPQKPTCTVPTGRAHTPRRSAGIAQVLLPTPGTLQRQAERSRAGSPGNASRLPSPVSTGMAGTRSW